MKQTDPPTNVGSTAGLGVTFETMKALHDRAWDALCDAAPESSFADLVVVGSLRKKFLLELQELIEQRDRMRTALVWYSDKARACAKNSHSGNHAAPKALLASVTVLALDGGRRADEALTPNVELT